MSGPGEYRADCTEGITCVEDLPQPLQVKRSRNYSRRPCPKCGRSWRSQISIATGRRGFLEENLTGSPKAEARTGAVIE